MASLESTIEDAELRIRELQTEIERLKFSEKKLQKSENLFRTLFQTSLDAISLNRMEDGVYVEVNPGFCDLTGYSREEVIGKSAREIGIWGDTGKTLEIVQELSRNGVIREIEVLFRLKSGRVGTGLYSARQIELDGAPHILSVTRPIEEWLRTKEALRVSEEKYRFLVENANEGIFVAQDGVLKFSNLVTREISGMSEADLKKTPFLDVIHPEDREMVLNYHQRRIQGKDAPNHYSFRVVDRDGETRWMDINTVIIEWEGRPATLNFLRDITRQKRLENQVRQAQKMEAITTLAGGIAHDFNNLLMGIQGNTSLMLLKSTVEGKDRERLKHIETYVRSASDLTKQLLGFAREGKYEVTQVDLNELVDRTVNNFARTKKEIRLHLKLASAVWPVKADRNQLEQVFYNLFINAWQAMIDGGELTVETGNQDFLTIPDRPAGLPADRFVRVAVSDTGVGIDQETQMRIFDPFFTTKEIERGTGLGLSAAYGIIENHGGRIQVYSEPNLGSTFEIFLPASAAEAETAEKHPSPELLRGHETLLLVDSEEVSRDVGRAMLEELGYRVITAAGRVEAVARFRSYDQEIDLVILCPAVTDLDWGVVLTDIRRIDSQVKVLLASSYHQNSDADKVLATGCDGFILKPYTLQKISTAIREVLNNEDTGAGASRSREE